MHPVQEWIRLRKSGMSVRRIARHAGVSEWMVHDRFKRAEFKPSWSKPLLDQAQAAWVAGVIDCDGMITASIVMNAKGAILVHVVARVHQVSPLIPSRLEELCGGRVNVVKPRGGDKRKQFAWNLNANGCRWLLPQIRQWLLPKRERCDVATELLSLPKATGEDADVVWTRRRELVTQLRRLNRRGRKAWEE